MKYEINNEKLYIHYYIFLSIYFPTENAIKQIIDAYFMLQ